MPVYAADGQPTLDRYGALPPLTDSHVHLDRYSVGEAPAIVARARAAGVQTLLTVGVDLASSQRALALTSRLPGVLAAVGVHPLHAEQLAPADLAALRRLLFQRGERPCAVGEIGLDWQGAKPTPPRRAAQYATFIAQLALAAEAELPVVLHSTDHHEVALILSDWRRQLPAVVVHYFTGDAADLARFRDLDCHISFGRVALKPGREELLRLSALVPADRLLLETDSYPLPGRTTEPRDLVELAEAVAATRGVSLAEMAAQTSAAFERVFRPASLTTV